MGWDHGLMRLRGGVHGTNGVYIPYHFTDQTANAAGFFNNIRVPAALLSGAALGQAFAMQKIDDDKFDTPSWKRLRTLYTTLMVISVASELLTVLMSTSASTHILAGNFDPMAESCIAMLKREFEWNLVAVQFNFITGMVAFVVAQAIRFYKELSTQLHTFYVARAACWLLGYASLEMLTFFNKHLIFEAGYPQLTWRYLTMMAERVDTPSEMLSHPVAVLAPLLLIAAVVDASHALLDADQDGKIDINDFKYFLAPVRNASRKVAHLVQGK